MAYMQNYKPYFDFERDIMKLTFLGTSHGLPSKTRYNSCTAIETNGNVYLIDCGAPVFDQLIRYDLVDFDTNPQVLKAIFTTHCHGDHTQGALPLLDLCNWKYKEASFDLFFTDELVLNANKTHVYALTTLPLDEDRLRLKIATEGKVFEDENIKVTYIRNYHLKDRPSYSLFVECEGKKILFTGDLSWELRENDFPQLAYTTKTDLIISEMAHFQLSTVAPCYKKCKTNHLIINHVYPFSKFEEIEQMNLNHEYDFEITIAEDGMSLEL